MDKRVMIALSAAGIVALAVVIGAVGLLEPVRNWLRPAPDEPVVASVEATPTTVEAPVEGGEPPASSATIPVFDIVRVEPTGDAVIAGQGAPLAEVEILSGADVVGTATANESGEWAIVLEEPLAPGPHDLSVRLTDAETGASAVSEQRVAVAVPEGGEGEVLVVLNQPGLPSDVLQLPRSDAGATVAADDGPAPVLPDAAEPPVGDLAVVAPAIDSPIDSAVVGDLSGVTPSGEAPADGAVAGTPGAPADDPALADPTRDAGIAAPTVAGIAPESQDGMSVVARDAPAMPNSGSLEPDTVAAVPGGSVAVAVAQPSAPAGGLAPAGSPGSAEQPSGAPPVTVEAVETEGGVVYAAGSAGAGAVVRVYVDGRLIGETVASESSRWLLTTEETLEPGEYLVRADQVDPADGAVVARAEVPFDRVADEEVLTPITVASRGEARFGAGGIGGASGVEVPSVIIRRGDNLWRIARRLYGRGVRFSTIYEANATQIRDPDMIYPGQIFMLPESDDSWTATQ
jgi:nucleoid-associated protein YgaU